MRHQKTIITCAMLTLVMAAILTAGFFSLRWLWNKATDAVPTITFREQTDTRMSPSHVQSIRNIGQWEFLSITDEEVVDTTRINTFIDDYLVEIFHGTLRLGIDLHTLREQDIEVSNDTVFMTLPKVTLLDDNFIDDTRTLVFHETGKWSADERAVLYERGKRMMKQRALTPQNIRHTKELAESQMRQIIEALGYQHVVFNN